jgi:hypothetical protein
VRVRKRPKRRTEAGGSNRLREASRFLEAVVLKQGYVSAYSGILGNVAVEIVSDFHPEVLCGNLIEKLSDLGILVVDSMGQLLDAVDDRDARE